jgi:hypothetical protein
MKVTLKKAQVLVDQLRAELKEIGYNRAIQLGPITDRASLEARANDLTNKYRDTVLKRLAIIDSINTLRMSIANANSNSGAQQLITQIAGLESEVRELKDALVCTVASPTMIDEALATSRSIEATGQRYGASGVTLYALTENHKEEITAHLTNTKRTLSDLKDRLAYTNMNNTVELTTEIAVLESLGLI